MAIYRTKLSLRYLGLPRQGEDEEEEVDESSSKSSPDADATILFVKPGASPATMAAGKLVRFHVGFTNKGQRQSRCPTRLGVGQSHST